MTQYGSTFAVACEAFTARDGPRCNFGLLQAPLEVDHSAAAMALRSNGVYLGNDRDVHAFLLQSNVPVLRIVHGVYGVVANMCTSANVDTAVGHYNNAAAVAQAKLDRLNAMTVAPLAAAVAAAAQHGDTVRAYRTMRWSERVVPFDLPFF